MPTDETIDPSRLTAWLASVTIEGSPDPVRVVLDGREGQVVYVRQVDPCDHDVERVPIYEGDQLVVMTALSHASVNTAEEAGESDEMILAKRIVPVRREPGHVFVRTLAHGEADDGRRVHVRPGDDVTIEPGALSVEIAALDAHEAAMSEGARYVPLTPMLGSWFAIGSHDQDKARYLSAAARRLDAARTLLDRVEELRSSLEDPSTLTAAKRRRVALDLIRTVEITIVTVGRVSHMIDKAAKIAKIPTPVSPVITSSHAAIKEIRDAYEHIEERAVGKSFGKVDPSALQIFDYQDLILHDKISYGVHVLDLKQELPGFIDAARNFIVDAAGDV
ncbi:hypothetical protein [Pseudonocardia sp. GCM10023141]|uniref:hypothetical protein n=1 Tax=Pseudonocardia sp. GCM10023141 TaxID=3252653 RepID=UPI003621930A